MEPGWFAKRYRIAELLAALSRSQAAYSDVRSRIQELPDRAHGGYGEKEFFTEILEGLNSGAVSSPLNKETLYHRVRDIIWDDPRMNEVATAEVTATMTEVVSPSWTQAVSLPPKIHGTPFSASGASVKPESPARSIAELLASISDHLADYRKGDIAPITTDHVERWIRQFDDDDRLPILQEMDHLLARYYISHHHEMKYAEQFLDNDALFGPTPQLGITRTQFLSIQRKGTSQRDLLALIGTIMGRKFAISMPCPASPQQYVYLDDCVYSGVTAFHDIVGWLPHARKEAVLHLVFWSAYRSGLDHLETKLRPIVESRGLDLMITVVSPFTFRNRPYDARQFDGFWPQSYTGDSHVDRVVDLVRTHAAQKEWPVRLFRPKGMPTAETTFFSPATRRVVEHAFLRAGAYIVSLPSNGQENLRPLGYEVLESLGFGALHVSHRNIANNCPLALWWGDPNMPAYNPLSKWHPLIPRRSNETPRVLARPDVLDDNDRPF